MKYCQFQQHAPTYYPKAQIIPRKPRPPEASILPKEEIRKDEIKEEEGGTTTEETTPTSEIGDEDLKPLKMEPMHVQTARSVDSHLNTPSTSTTVSPRVITQRSHTASPASTASDIIVPAPKKTSLPITPGTIVKRTVQTKAGLQTQYLKAFVNEKGEKIYRLLSPVTTTPTTPMPRTTPVINRGAAVSHQRVGNTMVNKNGDRLMVMRNQPGPNGTVFVKRLVSQGVGRGATRVVANGDGATGQIYRAVDGSLVRKTSTGQPVRGVVRHAVRPGVPAYGHNGYRVNLVGRGTGGSTMVHHQPLNAARRAPMGRIVGRGGVRATGQLHVSTSTPAFHYLEENQNQNTSPGIVQSTKTPGSGIIQARHMQHQQSYPPNGTLGAPARVLLSRSSTNGGLPRMVAGYEQPGGVGQYPGTSGGRMVISGNTVVSF